jgi:NAD+ kinase
MKIKIHKKTEIDFKRLEPLYREFEVTDNDAELCIAVGGDGTFVDAARSFSGPVLPIRSNERGSTGFFADLSINDVDFVVQRLKESKYLIEAIGRKIDIIHRDRHYYAINEASLDYVPPQEVHYKMYRIRNRAKESAFPYVMRGNGMVVTGSIGSTAYNRSLGGPIILDPDVFCITPIAPDGIYNSPIILSRREEFDIQIVQGSGKLAYDGILIDTLDKNESFYVKASDRTVDIVRFEDRREGLDAKLRRLIESRMII